MGNHPDRFDATPSARVGLSRATGSLESRSPSSRSSANSAPSWQWQWQWT